jgi:prevent-host-death family protein
VKKESTGSAADLSAAEPDHGALRPDLQGPEPPPQISGPAPSILIALAILAANIARMATLPGRGCTANKKILAAMHDDDYNGHEHKNLEVMTMKTAAVSALKASLSEYLAGVKAGEEVIVTDRGQPIAKLVPLQPGPEETPEELRNLERAGLVRIGTGRIPAAFWNEPRVVDREAAALAALLREREEGL